MSGMSSSIAIKAHRYVCSFQSILLSLALVHSFITIISCYYTLYIILRTNCCFFSVFSFDKSETQKCNPKLIIRLDIKSWCKCFLFITYSISSKTHFEIVILIQIQNINQVTNQSIKLREIMSESCSLKNYWLELVP